MVLVIAADFTAATPLVAATRRAEPTAIVLVVDPANPADSADSAAAHALLRAGASALLPNDVHLINQITRVANRILGERTRTPVLGPVNLVGVSEPMQLVFQLIRKAAASAITVSVRGETGTGKEEVARAIHLSSARAHKPFMGLNMAAIPRELLESELFGHEKGSFTGAFATRVGYFEQADGGTLFLDEIADLDLSLQAKLLRVVQERVFTRVGGTRAYPLTARLIVATHADLAERVRAGSFREDLYYRLLGLPILLPPLRKRGTDILLLAERFLREFCPPGAGRSVPVQFGGRAPAARPLLSRQRARAARGGRASLRTRRWPAD